MSENNKVGIDLQSTYKGEGVNAALADQKKLAEETKRQQAESVAAAEAYEKKRAEIAERIRQREERAAASAKDRLEKEARAGKEATDALVNGQEKLSAAASIGRVALAGVVLGGAAAAAATVSLGAAWAKSADQLGDLADKTGRTVEELSLMRLEAAEGETSVEKLAAGMKNLSVKMVEANSGKKQAIALFKALGVEYRDSAGNLRDTREVMDDVATAFAGMEQGAGKTYIASKLLGTGIGEGLIPYLDQGGDKLRAMRKEAEDLGLKIDTETAQAIDRMGKDLKILKLQAEGAAGELAGPLLRAVVEITTKMREGAKWGGLFGAAVGAVVGAGDAFVGRDGSMKSLQDSAGQMTTDIQRIEARLADPRVRGNQRVLLEQQLQAALQGQAAIYRQIGELEGSGVEDTPARRAAPDVVALAGKEKKGRTARPAKTRQQQLEEQDIRNWVRHADQVFADADRENLDNAKKAEREAEALDKLARSYRDMIDPMEPLRRKLADLDKLFAAGKITADEYTEGMFQIQNQMEDLNGTAKQIKDDGLEDLKNALHGWGRESSREIGRMVVDGEFNLKRLGNAFKNLAADIIASQVQKQWMDPLVKAGTTWLGGLFGGGGGSGVDTNLANVNALGNAYGPQGMVPFAMGGIVRRPTLFKFADGGTLRNGLMGEAGEEGILPLKRGRDGKLGVISSGGAGNIRVEIINQGAPQEVVSAQPSFDVDGMVVQIVTRDLRQGGPIRGSIESLMRPAA